MGFHLGLAVWAFPKWVGDFYPEGTRQADMLSLFTQRMACVEGNAVFYAVPPQSTLEKWREEMPEGFHLCPKIPREISHGGELGPRVPETLSFFRYLSEHLGPRLGPIFLQLPPSYAPQLGPDLARLLNAWRRETAHPLLVEVRHPSWFEPQWAERLDLLLSKLGLGRVMLDTRPVYSGVDDPQSESQRRKPRLPLRDALVGDVALVRYISHPEPERNARWLEEWAARVHGWLEAGVDVWFFVHCPYEEHSPGVARRLQRILEARGAPVPPLPWDHLPPPRQAALF